MVIKHGVNIFHSPNNRMLASSAVFRRQEFLIRCLAVGGHRQQFNRKLMPEAMDLEADAENILRAITPSLDLAKHKGQAGKSFSYHVYLFIYNWDLGSSLFFLLFIIYISIFVID